MKDTEKTKVLFRKCRKTFWGFSDEGMMEITMTGIIAIFPEIASNLDLDCVRIYSCLSGYVREHGDCNLEFIMESTVPASPEEYAEDAKYLESQYGYNLEVIESIPPNARDTRRASLESYMMEA